MSKVRIVKGKNIGTHIFVDDKRVENVKEYHLSESVDSVPCLELDVVPNIFDIELIGADVAYKITPELVEKSIEILKTAIKADNTLLDRLKKEFFGGVTIQRENESELGKLIIKNLGD